MTLRCETKTITVEELYNLYNDGTLVKPKIQRQKRWVDMDKEDKGKTNNLAFINFIEQTKNTVNPLLLVEKIINGEKYMFVIDGNNRINAILMFISKPLYLRSDLLPDTLPEEIKDHLINQPLIEICNYRNFQTYCKQNGFNDVLRNNIDTDMHVCFEDMCEKLFKMKFMDTKVPTTVFENISSDMMKYIYEGVNTGGVKLSKQEILASTTSMDKYYHSDLKKFNELYALVQTYYEDMNNNEKLKVHADKCDEDTSLNLFEVLLGFQRFLHQNFPSLIDEVGNKELDTVFRCFEIKYGKFEKRSPDEMNNFIEDIQKICEFIHSLKNCFYNSHISYNPIAKCKLSLKTNSLCILIIYVYKNIHLVNSKEFTAKIRKMLLYNELCSMMTEKKIKSKQNIKNALHYQAGGHYIMSVGKSILKDNLNDDNLPSHEDVVDAFHVVASNIVSPCRDCEKNKHRSKYHKFVLLVLSMYYNNTVPFEKLSISKDIDHIIPFSVLKWTDTLDIGRLGNLILLDSALNKQKGNKHINSSFVHNHQLHYLNYPSDDEVEKILSSNRKEVLDTFKYNCMCEKREKMYFSTIMETLK
jgi:hypothetical protein